MSIFKILLYFWLAFASSLNSSCEPQCRTDPSAHLIYDDYFSLLLNFDTFDQLLLDCNQAYNITDLLCILPNKKLLLDNSSKLDTIISAKKVRLISVVFLRNVIGIDIHSEPFTIQASNYALMIELGISLSKFDIYSNRTLVDYSQCDPLAYNNTNRFFNSFFSILFESVVYPKTWCPYFFLDSKIAKLEFKSVTNSFINMNRLHFWSVDTRTSHVFAKFLKWLSFDVFYETLNRDIFNYNLFKNVYSVAVFGVLNGVEASLFQETTQMRYLDFNIHNFKEFFHRDIAWMAHLNYYVNVDIFNASDIAAHIGLRLRLRFQNRKNKYSFQSVYEYPDEDFCRFYDFPHNRLVYPIIVPGLRLNCTCTLYWLQWFYRHYRMYLNFKSEYSLNYQAMPLSALTETFYFCDSTFEAYKCDFDKKFEACNLTETSAPKQTSHFYNDVDVFYLIKWFQFILLTILQPMFCLLGIGNNLITIVVIRNKKKAKDFKKPMYKHIQINATFNVIYCLIMTLKLVNTCIFFGSGIFCSSVYQAKSSQYFKIVVVHFLGNAIKMSSNFSYLSFSLSRLLLITKHKNDQATENASNKHYVVYFVSTLTMSCVLSTFRLFQYRINYALDTLKDFPYELREEYFCNLKLANSHCKLFKAFKIANRGLNDVLCVLLNILIDLTLIRKFKKYLDTKKVHSVGADHHKLIEQSKKNVNRMIFCNSTVYILSHLPEFASAILLIAFAQNFSKFCQNTFSCDLINEEAEFFCLISIVCQFYIFNLFDRNFSKSYKELKSRVWPFTARTKANSSTKLNSSSFNSTTELVNLRNLIGNGPID